jgi:hypothetical protein
VLTAMMAALEDVSVAMKKYLPLAFMALVGLAPPAAAQTAEEAVAYAFLGLADGARMERGGTTMNWVETAEAPATFDGAAVIGGHRSKIRFIVTAVEDCRYDITLEGPANLVPGGSRLFARVALRDISGITIGKDGFKSAIEGAGFCETGQRNPNCMTVHSADLFGSVDAERHREVVEFLRNDVCGVAIN